MCFFPNTQYIIQPDLLISMQMKILIGSHNFQIKFNWIASINTPGPSWTSFTPFFWTNHFPLLWTLVINTFAMHIHGRIWGTPPISLCIVSLLLSESSYSSSEFSKNSQKALIFGLPSNSEYTVSIGKEISEQNINMQFKPKALSVLRSLSQHYFLKFQKIICNLND